jgi:lipoate---protein ligase
MDKKVVVKVPAGKLLKLFVSVENNAIQKLQITGDFFAYPEEAIQQLEQRLLNHKLDQAQLAQTIHNFVVAQDVRFFGITEEALVGAIMQCVVDDGTSDEKNDEKNGALQ